MTTSKKTSKLLTADDLLRLYSEGVRGRVDKGGAAPNSVRWTETRRDCNDPGNTTGDFHQTAAIGQVGWLPTPASCLERNPDTVREPDIAFISAEKLPLDVDVPGFSDRWSPTWWSKSSHPPTALAAVNDKALMWLRFGVQLVWVIFPESRTLEVHSASASPVLLGQEDQLDGGAVLPGFTCQVSEIFER